MRYKFLGKPDWLFPYLKRGDVYDLTVVTREYGGFLWWGWKTGVEIKSPFYCPYSSWETFYKNWRKV